MNDADVRLQQIAVEAAMLVNTAAEPAVAAGRFVACFSAELVAGAQNLAVGQPMLREIGDRLTDQTRCDACGEPYVNKWAHAEECAGTAG